MSDSFKSASEVIYLTCDDRLLKIAKVRKAPSGKTVAGLYVKSIEGLSGADAGREIMTGLLTLRSKFRKVVLVLPSKYAITKTIEVPSLNDEEIQSIVRLQAVRHTPYSKEEVTVGHLNLEVMMERYTRTLLVIASNENIKKRTDAIVASGFEVEAVHLSFEVITKTVERIAGIEASQSGPYGCIYLDADSTDFIVIQNHRPYFVRSIPVGARLLKSVDSEGMRKLMDEIRKTWDACQAESQAAALKNFYVIGYRGVEFKLLAKAVEEGLKVSAKPVAAEEHFHFSPEAQAQLDKSGAHTFLDVIGDGVLPADQIALDLLPEDLKLKKSFRAKGREMFEMGIYMLAAFGFIVGIFLVQIYFRNNCLKAMKQGYEKKQVIANQLVAISEETKYMRNFRRKRGVALTAIDAFEKILPPQMYISEISLSDEAKMSVKGTSELMSLVFSFVTEMENSPIFMNVTSDYTKSRKEGDKDVSDFGLSCTLEEGAFHGK